jgi:hypothetical protein
LRCQANQADEQPDARQDGKDERQSIHSRRGVEVVFDRGVLVTVAADRRFLHQARAVAHHLLDEIVRQVHTHRRPAFAALVVHRRDRRK